LELAIEQFGRKSMLVPLKDRKRYEAVIMGMTQDRVYVLSVNPEVDVKIYKDDMDTYLGCGSWQLLGDEAAGHGQARELHSGVVMVPHGKTSLKPADRNASDRNASDRNRSRSPRQASRSHSRDHKSPSRDKGGRVGREGRDSKDGRDGRNRGRGSYIRREESPPPNSTPATAEQVKTVGGWSQPLRVGDMVKIMVTGYNAERRRWIFLPVQ